MVAVKRTWYSGDLTVNKYKKVCHQSYAKMPRMRCRFDNYNRPFITFSNLAILVTISFAFCNVVPDLKTNDGFENV